MPDYINRICFVDPQGQLATIDPDGGNHRTLSQGSYIFHFPAWSPGEAALAAIGSDQTGAGLFVFQDQARTGEPDRLYESAAERPFYLYWSPDGRQISFLATHLRDSLGLHLVSLADQTFRLLATGQPLYWSWNPAGDRLLIHSNSKRQDARLAFLDPALDHPAENIGQPGLFQAPGIASSGHIWAFADRDEFDNGQLVVKTSQNQAQIAVPHEGAIALNWSPCSDQLAFISPQVSVPRFYGPLRLLDASSKAVQTLVEAMVLAFFWAPDGQKIAYFTLADSTRPARSSASLPLNGYLNGAHRPERPGTRLQQPEPRPESLLLDLWTVDVASKQQRQLITFEPDTFFINQFLPFFDQYALSHRLWSPASDALILPVRDASSTHITLVPITGEPAETLAEGHMAFWSWR